jgi:dTDP-4-dehydrorhamnose 3,5-epimerase
MGSTLIPGVLLTPLKCISLDKGDVLHGMKKEDSGFVGFGEAYFSTVIQGTIKAWKRHREITLNLVVPVGEIRFVIYDDRLDSPAFEQYFSVYLSRKNYQRLTVPPNVWMGFQGVGDGLNLLLNIADLSHDQEEVDRLGQQKLGYHW